MPGDVLRFGEGVDYSDPERDGCDRAIEQPVGAGYPAQHTARPTRFCSIPGGLVLVPNRLDAGPVLRIFDVTHEVHRAFERSSHEATNHITFTAFRPAKPGAAERHPLPKGQRPPPPHFSTPLPLVSVLGGSQQNRTPHHSAGAREATAL